MKPEDFGISTPYICAMGHGLGASPTGEWKSWPPVVDRDKCVRCGTCVLSCPVQCIVEKDGKMFITLDYCKGCGVCIEQCPKKAIAFDKGGPANG